MQSAEATQSLLYDYYGGLLRDRPGEVYRLYHEDNLSLTEIADELGVSKQAVHTALKRAERTLQSFEDGLGLIAKHEVYERVIAEVSKLIDSELAADAALVKDLRRIKKMIKELDI